MKSAIKKIGGIIAILAVVTVVALGAGLLLGYVSISVGSQQATKGGVGYAQVCTADDIKSYNSYVSAVTPNAEVQAQKAQDIQTFVDTIQTRSGVEGDPTCVYMMYSAAVTSGDATKAEAYYNTIKTLSEEGKFPNNTVLDLASLSSMSDRITILKESNQPTNNSQGSG